MTRGSGTGAGRALFLCGAALFSAAPGLAGCSSNPDASYTEYYRAARQGLSQTLGTRRVSRAEVAALARPGMGYRVNGGAQNLLALASDTEGDLLWTAKNNIAILTRGGRIVRTVGLPRDMALATPREGDTIPPPAAALTAPFTTARLADFPGVSAYNVPLTCRTSAAGRETIIILDEPHQTVRADETCSSAGLGWSFVNRYWIEPQSGLVLRSLQHIHPDGETVETELFARPG